MRYAQLISTVVLLGAPYWALAQDDDPEALATVQQGEVGRIDRDSIKHYGSTSRFEVTITWDQTQAPRPTEHLARKVRYVADCKAGTMTIAAIGAFHTSGRAVKTMVIPPGASDATTPSPDSQQARWLKDACANS